MFVIHFYDFNEYHLYYEVINFILLFRIFRYLFIHFIFFLKKMHIDVCISLLIIYHLIIFIINV